MKLYRMKSLTKAAEVEYTTNFITLLSLFKNQEIGHKLDKLCNLQLIITAHERNHFEIGLIIIQVVPVANGLSKTMKSGIEVMAMLLQFQGVDVMPFRAFQEIWTYSSQSSQ
ncbi:Hypothetical predicted protein [Octopus vulgaris]|uniref:Uncharacterized protein n=1 Tax=Octopus vulgaris TaxID=6645 RepID=A0AA36F0D6_OCTVU|nr:Hypothetical predicted protein [Octopus vulgaris]